MTTSGLVVNSNGGETQCRSVSVLVLDLLEVRYPVQRHDGSPVQGFRLRETGTLQVRFSEKRSRRNMDGVIFTWDKDHILSTVSSDNTIMFHVPFWIVSV